MKNREKLPVTRTTCFMFPLRKDLNISIAGLPLDLTQREVDRISRSLEAWVIPEKEVDPANVEKVLL